jgi:predicted dehydrogenase
MEHTIATAPLRLAFIGGSRSSAVGYSHFVSSAMDGLWTLVAGCFSRHADSNQESGQLYGVSPERIYANWQQLLECEHGRIDAVVILTPTPSHVDSVLACMRAGIPVICEKSLAVSSEQARQIIAVRDEQQAFLAVTYNYAGYPMLRELERMIRDGKLGKLLHFQAEMPQEGFVRVDASGNRPTPQAWRLSDGAIPTLHLDLGVHLHQMVAYLTGQKPVELVSDQNHYGWFAGVVDNAGCLCQYSGNIQGQFWFSKSALGHRNGLRIRIYGDLASAEWYQGQPEELTLSHIDGRREIIDRAGQVQVTNALRYNRFKAGHPAGFIEAFANLYGDIAVGVRQFQQGQPWQESTVFGAELALEGLLFLEAMVASSQNRRWETIKA